MLSRRDDAKMGVVRLRNGRGQNFQRALRAIVLFWPLHPSASSYAYDLEFYNCCYGIQDILNTVDPLASVSNYYLTSLVPRPLERGGGIL